MADQSQTLNMIGIARDEYTRQLGEIMLPFVVETFTEMHTRATEDAKGKNVLMKFQLYLKDIKNWNQGMIKANTDKITKSCAYFGDLLAAVFVSYVKILSCVRLKKECQKISIKLPSNEEFVYALYEDIAKVLYKNPYIFSDDNTDDEIVTKFEAINTSSMDKVIKAMVPMQEILSAYINHKGDMPQDSFDVGEENTTEPGDVDEEEDAPFPTPTPEDNFGSVNPNPEQPTDSDIPPPSGETEEPEIPPEEDVKNVSFGGKPDMDEDEDEDEDLFPDAPEEK